MSGCMGRLMVLMLWLTSVASFALEPEAETTPVPDEAALAAMAETMVIRDDRVLREAVASFQAGHEGGAFWLDQQRLPQLLGALDELVTDGLNPADYGVEQLRAWQRGGVQDAALENLATRAYLLALLHLYRGKVDPAALDAHWNFAPATPDIQGLLAKAREAADAGRIASAFTYARPVRPEYNGLRAALARLRGQGYEGGWPVVPAGKPLKPGMTDARVAILRSRLQQAGLASRVLTGEPTYFDDELALALMRFQREAYLEPDGVAGPQTLRVLNVPLQQRIDQLRANLERMRWVHDPGMGPMVVVDIAGFRIVYMREGKAAWVSRVQVGRAYRSTPVFRATITHLTLNPTWTVPPTIMAKDVLPKVRKDRGYLKKNNLRVFTRDGRAIPARSVNWWRPGNIILRQDAGEDNSLGQLAIRFPNPYAVYLHDTPHKELFESSQRAFSSGCTRVENIHELAVLLLNDPANWSRKALDTAIADGKTRQVNLVTPIPIMLVYWTVDVAADGYVSFKADIYERDQPLVRVLDRAVVM